MELRVPESELAALPTPPPGLGSEPLSAWRRMRRKAGRRHEAWRIGMPGLDDLFDSDSQRAKALAGNLATELGEVLRRTAESSPRAVALEGAPTGWLEQSCQEWVGAIEHGRVEASWSAETAAAFEQLVSELVRRERDRAVDLAVRTQSREVPPAAGSRLAAAGYWLLTPVRRFLRPR